MRSTLSIFLNPFDQVKSVALLEIQNIKIDNYSSESIYISFDSCTDNTGTITLKRSKEQKRLLDIAENRRGKV